MLSQLKPALRQFRKYPVFSAINIGGLSIGIAASFILLVYSQRELNTDHQFKDARQIARICTDFFHMGPFAVSQTMLRPLLKATCKDVEDATAVDRDGSLNIRTSLNERAFTTNEAYEIDSSFFHVFSYTASAGAIPAGGLSPGETILSESKARQFFGKQDAIGKTLFIGKRNTPYTVIAILHEDVGRSHLQPEILLPRLPDPSDNTSGWASCSLYNYVKLKPGSTMADLQTWIDRLRLKVVYPSTGATMPYKDWTTSATTISFLVQPLTSIYFDGRPLFDLSPGGNLVQVRLLASVAVLLILLAIINYVNLVTARSSIRSKEMGLKKTFGADRRTLIAQVLRESILFSFVAMLLACSLIQAILFIYQYSTGAALTGPIPFLSANLLYLVAFSLVVGALAGSYPAFFLSGERNRMNIRSSAAGREPSLVRNVLVTLQFVIATGLVFISLVVYSQLHFMKNKDKGFRSQGLVVINNAGELNDHAEAFRQLVEQQSAVRSTSFCTRTPAGNSITMGTYEIPGMHKTLNIQEFPADDHYINTLGMHLISGRNFEKTLASDTNALILNESAVTALGLFNPLGALINGSERVIGVVKDFNYTSFHEKIGPAVLRYRPAGASTFVIRLGGGNTAAFLDWLRSTVKKYMPDTPLNITFMDENFARLAAKERILGNAISFFTVLAIILAAMGLIGLTLFTIERRTREIGIRRVLGATQKDILGLVLANFLRLALVAGAISLPLSWWLIRRWLDNFAYRVSVGPGAFVLAVLLILLIAFTVIGILTLRAIETNPARTLKTE
jgi:putative ABC transport system permease protein